MTAATDRTHRLFAAGAILAVWFASVSAPAASSAKPLALRLGSGEKSLERYREYGYNAAILHNGTSHDEEGNANAWLMLARYAVAAASHGVPMVYMSQPLGVPYKVDFQNSWQDLKWFWDRANPQVFGLYGRINGAAFALTANDCHDFLAQSRPPIPSHITLRYLYQMRTNSR